MSNKIIKFFSTLITTLLVWFGSMSRALAQSSSENTTGGDSTSPSPLPNYEDFIDDVMTLNLLDIPI